MKDADALLDWLASRPSVDGVDVIGWRIEVARSEAIRVGIRDGRLGGPYEAPGVASRLAGSLDLHWSDGRLTRTRLDRRDVADPAGSVSAWRATSAVERYRPPIAAPASLPKVQVHDPSLAQAVAEEPSRLLSLLRRAQEAARAGRVRRLDAVLRASVGPRIVRTSAGFACGWHETALSMEVWIDEVASAAFSMRRLPTDGELERLLADALTRGAQLRHETPLPSGARGVLFMPGAVDALLGRFFLPNLSGRAMLEGRSAFSRADLDSRRLVLADDLGLVVDTTLPFELATSPCSPDGVPAERAVLVEAGRLKAPILDVATAPEMAHPPTPAPRGRPYLLLVSERPQDDIASGLERLGDGAIVRELPGLHTQSAQRWTYALVVPDAQAVVGGVPGGRCAIRISGNLVEHLQSPSTRLSRVAGEANPALIVLDGVKIEPS